MDDFQDESIDQPNQNFLATFEPFSRRKWTVITPTLLGALISTFIAFSLPKIYRSTTLILVEQQKVSEKYVTPTDSTPMTQRLNTIKQQIMSRTNLEKIIKNLDLYDGAVSENVLEKMREDINVEILGGDKRRGSMGDAFSISYFGKDRQRTMNVTNTLASMFIDENLKTREQYAEGTSEFLAGELEKAKRALEQQEAALREFKEKNMGALPGQLDTNLRTLDRLQLQLQSTRDSLKNTHDRKALLEEQLSVLNSIEKIPVTEESGIPLEVELANLKAELRSLLSVYKESYPDITIVKNRIHNIEKELAFEKKSQMLNPPGRTDKKKVFEATSLGTSQRLSKIYTDLKMMNSQINLLTRQETDIIRQIQGYEKLVKAVPANEQKLADIQRDYEISLKNYQSLLEKKNSASLAENLEKRQKGERFRVIDPANLPGKPFKPNIQKIMLLGTIAGGGMGIGLVLLLELLNPVFRKTEDLDDILPWPVMAAIPDYSEKNLKKEKKILKKLKERRT